MKKIFVAAAVSSVLLFSCKDKKQEPEVVTIDNSPDAPAEVYKVERSQAEFNSPEVAMAFEHYLLVQEALINTDSHLTSDYAEKLKESAKDIDGNSGLLAATTAIIEAGDVEEQRIHFEDLTDEMEKIVKTSLKSGTIYKQYCPMAFDDKGAYWLSSSKDILNPYFGDKMLKCGSVRGEIN